MPEVEEKGIPSTPPPWWPRYWPWPPTEAWFANVKRTYDFSESPGFEKDWEHRARVKGFEYREAKGEEDTRAAEKAMLDQRLKFSDALWATALQQMNSIHAMTLQVIADNLADARVARSVTYSLNATLLESLADKFKEASAQIADVAASLTGLKELMGPPRGGVTPATGGTIPEKKS